MKTGRGYRRKAYNQVGNSRSGNSRQENSWRKKSKDFKPECYTEKINLETEKLHEKDIARLHSDDKTEILK